MTSSDPTERLVQALADRYGIESDVPALKDAVPDCPSGHVAARRAAPSRGFSPGTPRDGA